MKEILGKKIGMTRVFREDGEAVPVTVIEAGPCPVIKRKTKDKDGYEAYQVAFGKERKAREGAAAARRKKNSQTSKPVLGQFKKAGVEPRQYLREVRYDEAELNPGDELKVDIFSVGEKVDVTGVSRGLGFAGTMKRHHFQGANKTHGQSDRWRAPGSIGQSSYPSRVFKGIKMAGRMGKDTVTVINLEVVRIIESENLLLVRGPVPGFRGGLLRIRKSNRSRT